MLNFFVDKKYFSLLLIPKKFMIMPAQDISIMIGKNSLVLAMSISGCFIRSFIPKKKNINPTIKNFSAIQKLVLFKPFCSFLEKSLNLFIFAPSFFYVMFVLSLILERVGGIEPPSSAWKADIMSRYTIPAF